MENKQCLNQINCHSAWKELQMPKSSPKGHLKCAINLRSVFKNKLRMSKDFALLMSNRSSIVPVYKKNYSKT